MSALKPALHATVFATKFCTNGDAECSTQQPAFRATDKCSIDTTKHPAFKPALSAALLSTIVSAHHPALWTAVLAAQRLSKHPADLCS